ncbi:hypothetical protein HPB51_012651 [Rhipicephalus microplus]|uniref:Uncharacterized protein n=1 Tax=Rhipicephalus microplus TaxID=6941 RepID=A0A9J6E1M7_RHIMP|nr:hypothetical protein HPB51_012651 [Rhipicephalus microplus]
MRQYLKTENTKSYFERDFFPSSQDVIRFRSTSPAMAGADYSPAVCKAVDESASRLRQLSMDLWNNPELAFKEVKSHDLLTWFLEERGLKVQRKVPPGHGV